MRRFPENVDVDREALLKLDDREFFKACIADNYTWSTVCGDETFLRKRLQKYPNIVQYKKAGESFKNFYLRTIRIIALLKEQFNYDYEFGNPFTQHKLLEKYYEKDGYDRDINDLMKESAGKGELSMIIWSLKHGADIHSQNDYALVYASQTGKLEVVKYLVENGANVHTQNGLALMFAKSNEHSDVVKYLESIM